MWAATPVLTVVGDAGHVDSRAGMAHFFGADDYLILMVGEVADGHSVAAPAFAAWVRTTRGY
jgi:hypothetical protein